MLRTRRRNKLMEDLAGHINGLERILGNSDRLRPGRGNREEAAILVYFNRFRDQATNLHEAICRSLHCTCPGLHSSQLLLWRSYNNSLNTFLSKSLMLRVYFPRRSKRWSQNPKVIQPENDWFASDVEVTMRSNTRNESDMEVYKQPVVPDGAVEISDLCAALHVVKDSTCCLGYLFSNDGKPLILHKPKKDIVSPSTVRKVVKLRELFENGQGSTFNTVTRAKLPRVARLSVAIKWSKLYCNCLTHLG